MYEALTAKAAEAAANAYAPYSHFSVGAALLCADGTVFCGCNVESGALCAAVAAGRRRFTALAVYTPDDCASFYPCAVCLQALSEFCGPDLEILCTAGGRTIRRTLGELLPFSFRLGGEAQCI